MVTLTYYKGLILSDAYAPGLKWNSHFKKYIGFASLYSDLVEYFEDAGVTINDNVLDLLPFPNINGDIELRDYQRKAVETWIKSKRGIIVMPTGAGKTRVALAIITKLKIATLVVVPTIDLLNQWYREINELLKCEPGRIGGNYDELKGITVITYDSAYSRSEELGNRFGLLVFDEVHHLPSEGYMNIAQLFAAPYRLGLTATPGREDGRDSLYPQLVGPIVYRISVDKLAGKYLAEYDIERIYVNLTEEEEKKYKQLRQIYREYLKEKGLKLSSLEDFYKFLKIAAKEKNGRDAILAWYEALKIAVNSQAKLDKLKELLQEYQNEKIIVFTRDTELTYRVSKEFLIPAVTYKTPKDEREEILEKFRKGDYKVIVTSNVFDEGVDVPDASLAIILGGYGTSRQFLQRLGRILRKKEGKRAKLIEIVTKGTSDYNLSRRRRKNVTV